MNEKYQPDSRISSLPQPAGRSFRRRLGAGSLGISLFFHGLLLVGGALWIFHVRSPDKTMEIGSHSGGRSPSSDTKQEQQRVRMMQPDLARLTANGASGIILPEPGRVSGMASLGSISSGVLGGGIDGSGKGRNGKSGDGALVPGMSANAGSPGPFGRATLDKNALVGTFYDLKQTKDRKPTDMTDTKMREELKEITRRGFRETVFDKYFKAPRKLYQTKFFIPIIPADGAPAAFEVEKEVQPRMWIVVYRGAVKAPKSGKFRFVGECDDLLAVRFNSRPVFDYGYTMAGTGTHVNGRAAEFDGTTENVELAKDVRKLTPMKLPITFYKYDSTPAHNRNIGGLAVGPEFAVEAGKTYPIEIMIGEIPGGNFSMALMIEEIGATYKKDPAGFPILPLFRLHSDLPSEEIRSEAPPFDKNGPVWKFSASNSKLDI